MNKFFLAVFIVCVFLVPVLTQAQAPEFVFFYVSPNGDDNNEGTTQSEALRHIQAAIDKAIALTPIGFDCHIFVKPGFYAENIALDQRRHLYGGVDFPENEIDPESTDPQECFDPVGEEYVIAEGEIFRPNPLKEWGGTSTIFGDSSAPVIRMRAQADDLADGISNFITNFEIAGGNTGVLCDDIFSPFLRLSTITLCTGIGLDATYSSPIVDRCTITECLGHGVYIQDDPMALPMPFPANPSFISCDISENGGSGIYALSTTWQGILMDSNVSKNTFYGVYMSGSKPSITGCDMNENGYDGLRVENDGDPIVTSCLINLNNGNGVVIGTDCAATIEGNQIDQNTSSGMFLNYCTGPEINFNSISYNESYGIKTAGDATAVCNSNVLWYNKKVGIQINRFSSLTLRNNDVLYNNGAGVEVSHEANLVLETLNVIGGNEGEGVLLMDQAVAAFRDRNIIFSNAFNGIKAIDDAQAWIEQGLIYSNGKNGVLCSNDAKLTLENNVLCHNNLSGVFIETPGGIWLRNNILAHNGQYGLTESSNNSDPSQVWNNCFYDNFEGNYLDEKIYVYETASDINTKVQNAADNIVDDPKFVKWGNFSMTNPIYVDSAYDGATPDGSIDHPFRFILEALVQHNYHLTGGSPCIGAGIGGKDIGAYPDGEDPYPSEGSQRVKIIVIPNPLPYEEVNLIIPDGVTLEGNETKIRGAEGSNIFYLLGSAVVRGFVMTEGDIAVVCNANSLGAVDDCSISNTYFAGVFLYRSYATVQNSTISMNERYGIRCYGGDPIIAGNTIKQNIMEGIFCEYNSHPFILANEVSMNEACGIKLANQCSPVIDNNTIRGNSDSGILMDNKCHPLIRSNLIELQIYDGISISLNSSPQVIKNTIKGNLGMGVYVRDNSHPTIQKNNIYDNAWDGIMCEYGCVVSIANNMIWNNSDDAISLLFESNGFVYNNTLLDSFNNGIFIRSASPYLKNNLIKGNFIGIYEYDNLSDPAVFSYNYLDDHTYSDYFDDGQFFYTFPGHDLNTVVNNMGGEVMGNIYGEAALRDPANANFRLNPTSICIDAGGNVPGVDEDFEGEPRPFDFTPEVRGDGSDYDIGADEFYTGTVIGFPFFSGTEGWTFAGKITPYDEPMDYFTGKPGLSPAGSDFCYSYWQSIPFAIQDGKVYDAEWSVGSSVWNPDNTVQFRLRVNQLGSWQAWDRIVNSFNAQAPSVEESKKYHLYFDPNVTDASDQSAQLSFDIMSFDMADDTYSWLFLEEVRVETVEATAGAQIVSYSFDSGAEGWNYSGAVPPYDEPTTSTLDSRLGLNPDGSSNCFAYWFSPDISIEAGKNYRATFGISSSVLIPDDSPQLRVRVNQKGAWQAWNRIVNSNNSQGPLSDPVKTYQIILDPAVTGPAADDILNLSFDIMSFDAADDTSAWLYLNEALVEEITLTP